MKKGKKFQYIKDLMQLGGYMVKAKERQNHDWINRLQERMDTHQAKYDLYMEDFDFITPTKMTEKQYQWHIQNVTLYYTFWKREDIYNTKQSLNMIRGYEKRNKLEAFDEVISRNKRSNEILRLNAIYGG